MFLKFSKCMTLFCTRFFAPQSNFFKFYRGSVHTGKNKYIFVLIGLKLAILNKLIIIIIRYNFKPIFYIWSNNANNWVNNLCNCNLHLTNIILAFNL